MFEARLKEGNDFKHVIEAIKELLTDTNMDCTEEELTIQAMDSAHVSLVAVCFKSEEFLDYRCDRSLSLGMNTSNMSKIFKMMGKDDTLVLKAEDDGDNLTIMFESNEASTIADFELKLMDIDVEQMAIPETPYKCSVKMPSSEFQRIVRDMQALGDTCTISCTKEGIKFSVSGEIGTGSVLLRANATHKDENNHVVIDMQEPVELNFAMRYLVLFCKATALSKYVNISLSPNVPVVVEYPLGQHGNSFVKFFLAPKVDDEMDEDAEDDNNPAE